jgi:hypothetical protein
MSNRAYRVTGRWWNCNKPTSRVSSLTAAKGPNAPQAILTAHTPRDRKTENLEATTPTTFAFSTSASCFLGLRPIRRRSLMQVARRRRTTRKADASRTRRDRLHYHWRCRSCPTSARVSEEGRKRTPASGHMRPHPVQTHLRPRSRCPALVQRTHRASRPGRRSRGRTAGRGPSTLPCLRRHHRAVGRRLIGLQRRHHLRQRRARVSPGTTFAAWRRKERKPYLDRLGTHRGRSSRLDRRSRRLDRLGSRPGSRRR